MRIPKEIREQMIFALEDDNEIMTSALDSDLDNENKKMNISLIKQHNKILDKLENKRALTKLELKIVRDANEIFVNDDINATERHKEGVMLDKWLNDNSD